MSLARRPALAVALAALLVLAGCSLPPFGLREDPNDRLGWENGYAANASLPVTEDDGLNESEREAVVARSMARVELIRDLEFRESVPVRLVTREEYRESRGGGETDAARRAFEDVVWEASFVVGETRDAAEARETVFGSAVLGFYSRNGNIVIVSDSETPTLDPRTLAHELVHALQDQRLSLGPNRPTRDGNLARNGLVEGDANYVEARYAERCESEWSCLALLNQSGATRPDGFVEGIYQTAIHPYVIGPRFVDSLRERGGWEAVNDAYEDFPASTEQTIHPEKYGAEAPVEVTVEDRTSGGWERFDVDHPTQTLGEASIYVTFSQTGVVGEDHATYNYSHPLSAGWAGDRLVPYRLDEGGATEYGYVWKTEWDTPENARVFLAGYRDLLATYNATRDGDVYVIPEGGYADAFRVTREGTTVTIVNAPTTDALDRVHARE
ncbi:Hvo_1808 family surface protein [Halomarina litorea]|uniref:Hvo_1808 family surface protein n=1 Tax=Halomarina litorea TaxID=2961595 RepID=UPI0020C1DD2D|nr:Hvo_1808 family surface protein [Halomarina sp. BCD28]